MILNIIIMAWLAFNLVWLLDAIIANWQVKKYKQTIHCLRQSDNWDYAKWKADAPKHAFQFKKFYWWIWLIGFPCVLVVAFYFITQRVAVAFIAAIRTFFNTFFETLKGGAR